MIQSVDLLRSVLAAQIDDGSGDTLAEERILDVLNGRSEFTNAERRLLWAAPVARQRYLRIRREMVARAEAIMARDNIGRSSQPMAAASDQDRYVLEVGDSTLRVIRSPTPELPLLLILRLGERFLKCLPRGLAVRLADTGDRNWLVGRPNDFGEVHGTWDDTTTSPMQRLVDHRLIISPI